MTLVMLCQICLGPQFQIFTCYIELLLKFTKFNFELFFEVKERPNFWNCTQQQQQCVQCRKSLKNAISIHPNGQHLLCIIYMLLNTSTHRSCCMKYIETNICHSRLGGWFWIKCERNFLHLTLNITLYSGWLNKENQQKP